MYINITRLLFILVLFYNNILFTTVLSINKKCCNKNYNLVSYLNFDQYLHYKNLYSSILSLQKLYSFIEGNKNYDKLNFKFKNFIKYEFNYYKNIYKDNKEKFVDIILNILSKIDNISLVKNIIYSLKEIDWDLDKTYLSYDSCLPLIYAVRKNNTLLVRNLLLGCNPNIKDKDGTPLLIIALIHDHENIIDMLLNCENIDVNIIDQSQYSPLMHAIMFNNFNLVIKLVEKGAYVNYVNSSNYSPLILASIFGYKKIVNYLLEKGAYVDLFFDHFNSPRFTALIYAAINNNAKIIKMLIKKGAAIDKKDINGNTALLYAVKFGNLKAIKTLLKLGADINAKDFYSNDVFSLAKKRGYKDILELLFSYKSKNTLHI